MTKPSRDHWDWTTGEHSIMLSLLNEYKLPISKVASILKRTNGAITSRMRVVILDYHFTKKYSIEQIVSRFNFDEKRVIRVINNQQQYYTRTAGTKYKECSKFDEVMEMLDKVKKVQMENGTFDMEAYAKLVDYTMKPYGINIFPK